MVLLKEISESKKILNQNDNNVLKLTGLKYKCIKTTLSTSEKAFINVLVSEDPMLKPSGKMTDDIELELPYWDNKDFKIPILPYETIFEVFDNTSNIALCFNVVIHNSVTLLDSDDENIRNVFIDWCYQVLELKFNLKFFFNRWEGKIMKNLKFKRFSESTDDELEFVLDEEEEDTSGDDEFKNILISKALLDEEDEEEGENIIINGIGSTNEPLKTGLIQEVEMDHVLNTTKVEGKESNESLSMQNKISSDLNF
ncbi:hypothetical protein QEN19_001262 [Hanseniaspora menglaensis]